MKRKNSSTVSKKKAKRKHLWKNGKREDEHKSSSEPEECVADDRENRKQKDEYKSSSEAEECVADGRENGKQKDEYKSSSEPEECMADDCEGKEENKSLSECGPSICELNLSDNQSLSDKVEENMQIKKSSVKCKQEEDESPDSYFILTSDDEVKSLDSYEVPTSEEDSLSGRKSYEALESDEVQSSESCKISESDEFESSDSHQSLSSDEDIPPVFYTRVIFPSETSTSAEDESTDSSDEDFKIEKKRSKNKKFKHKMKGKCPSTVSKAGKQNEYEKMIQKQRDEKFAFLESLKINELKGELKEAIENLEPKRNLFKPRMVLPRRQKLSRLAKVDFDLSEKALEARATGPVTHEPSKKWNDEISLSEGNSDSDPSQHNETYPSRASRRLARADVDLSEKAMFARNLAKAKEEAQKLYQAAEAERRRKAAARVERLRRCPTANIPRVLFDKKLNRLVNDKSPLHLSVLLNRLPVSSSTEEFLAVEHSFLALKYGLVTEHSQLTGMDGDTGSLEINKCLRHLASVRSRRLKIPVVFFDRRVKNVVSGVSPLQLNVLLNRLAATDSLQKRIAMENYFLFWKYCLRRRVGRSEVETQDIDSLHQYPDSPVADIHDSRSRKVTKSTNVVRSPRMESSGTGSRPVVEFAKVIRDRGVKQPDEDESPLQLGVLLKRLPSSGSLEERNALENSFQKGMNQNISQDIDSLHQHLDSPVKDINVSRSRRITRINRIKN